MKKVLSPDMVAHAWANQTQEEARTASNGSLYFDKESIFSYGRHFTIAKHVSNKKGANAVLFTTRGYSNTTAKHISIVRHASNHLNKIYCNDPADSPRLNIESFEIEIKSALSGLAKAKKPEKYIQPAEYALQKAEIYCKFFDEKVPKHFYKLIESAKTGKYKDYLAKEAERIAKEKAEARERQTKQHNKNISNWRKFKNDKGEHSPQSRLWTRLDKDFLRISEDGEKIQTSQGIDIPLPVAKRILNTIRTVLSKGGCNGDCNFKILDLSVKEINKEFIRVGCHNIDWKEINSIAKKLNW
jgi:hypothetical protein